MLVDSNIYKNNIIFKPLYFYKEYDMGIKKYIINKNATIIFWDDDTKTISKRHQEDKFDKELGFLFAYYYKKCGLTNAARKRLLDCIDYSKIKTLLFEMFVKYSDKNPDQARSYLKNLKLS